MGNGKWQRGDSEKGLCVLIQSPRVPEIRERGKLAGIAEGLRVLNEAPAVLHGTKSSLMRRPGSTGPSRWAPLLSHFLYSVPVPPFSSSLSGLPPAAGSPSSQPLCVGKNQDKNSKNFRSLLPHRNGESSFLQAFKTLFVPTTPRSPFVPGPHTHIQPTDVSVWSANEHLEFMSQMGLLTSPCLPHLGDG